MNEILKNDNIITAIVGLIVAMLGYLTNLFRKKLKPKYSPLKKHCLFKQIEVMKIKIVHSFFIDRSVHDARLKEYAFRDLMYNKLCIWEKLLKELVVSVQNEKDCSISYKLHLELFHKGMDKYCNYYKNDLYTKKEQQAMEIIMQKFNNLHRVNVDLVAGAVNDFHNESAFSSSIHEINNNILTVYQVAFLKMYSDVEKIIVELNGDLKGLEFRKREYN